MELRFHSRSEPNRYLRRNQHQRSVNEIRKDVPDLPCYNLRIGNIVFIYRGIEGHPYEVGIMNRLCDRCRKNETPRGEL